MNKPKKRPCIAYLRARLWYKSVKIDPLSVYQATKLTTEKSTIA